MTVAEVQMWGSTIGAVSVERPGEAAAFEYTPQFAASGIEVAPLEMPLSRQLYHFPGLGEAFHGLPGLLADSLPDKFGNAVLDAWLATQGRMPQEINAVERLLYTAARGMGALEFRPALGPRANESATLEVGALLSGIGERRARDPARRDVGWRRTREGCDRLESSHERSALGAGARAGRLRLLAAQVRRRDRQPRP